MRTPATFQDAVELRTDRFLYGNSFMDENGKRIDPKRVIIATAEVKKNGPFSNVKARIDDDDWQDWIGCAQHLPHGDRWRWWRPKSA